jgi:hypothetical protein
MEENHGVGLGLNTYDTTFAFALLVTRLSLPFMSSYACNVIKYLVGQNLLPIFLDIGCVIYLGFGWEGGRL